MDVGVGCQFYPSVEDFLKDPFSKLLPKGWMRKHYPAGGKKQGQRTMGECKVKRGREEQVRLK